MINTTNLVDALPIMVKDESVFEALKADFPDILADLVTFKSNPNCTCRGRVFKFFTEKLEQNPTCLDKYVKDTAALTTELNTIKNQRMLNNYSGKVFTIENSEASWEEFSKSLAGKMFRSFAVIEKDNNLKVYFV
jgi:hypothetical protein